MTTAAPPPRVTPEVEPAPRRPRRRRTSLFAHGEPMVWLTGGSLAFCLFMIVGLLFLVLVNGAATFWPAPLVHIETTAGTHYLGEITRTETFVPPDRTEEHVRRLYRTENFELTNSHFHWVEDGEVASRDEPEWAILLERQSGGHFYGYPVAFLVDGDEVATGHEATWAKFEEHHDVVRDRFDRIREIEEDELGALSDEQEVARLELRQVELDHGKHSPAYAAAKERHDAEVARIAEELVVVRKRLADLAAENAPFAMRMRTADGVETVVPVDAIVRAFPPNQLGLLDKVGVYLSRWWEFLSDDPREANSEGGVWPAIYGTILMTLLMTILVVPFGVLAALYLREYAKAGPVVSTIRIAINNLAGVPSIVFGVFGLGFFCYVIGAGIDEAFFEARLPSPTFGKSGLIWASITLALLTLPVVIVATEEALAAVPSSMREGSYACGASKWQTVKRIVMPRAMPGIMTGMILAIARAAGEVAPLMLVGAVKLAPELPGEIDSIAPYVHVERSFMHLGFHIYDLGFQSPNSEAAKPMVFTTTLLLITIVVVLNVAAILIRNRLRKRFETGQF